jgi:hypothetical protein
MKPGTALTALDNLGFADEASLSIAHPGDDEQIEDTYRGVRHRTRASWPGFVDHPRRGVVL